MKYFSIIEPATKEAILAFNKKYLSDYPGYSQKHPQEDQFAISKPMKTFVVSDGVTLNYKKIAAENIKYPNPSPAGNVAKIFCEAVIESTRSKLLELDKQSLENIFIEANNKVALYDKKLGKTDLAGNKIGYFAATGVFVIIKEKKMYLASICDSFVTHFDKDMNLKFITDDSCKPYAVINGEKEMAKYIEKRVFEIKKGDRIFLFTDGYEYYFQNKEFLQLFKEWSKKINTKDPEKYGHERTLIGILI